MDRGPRGLSLQELAAEDPPSPRLERPAYASSLAASILASRAGESAVEGEGGGSAEGLGEETLSLFAGSFAGGPGGLGGLGMLGPGLGAWPGQPALGSATVVGEGGRDVGPGAPGGAPGGALDFAPDASPDPSPGSTPVSISGPGTPLPDSPPSPREPPLSPAAAEGLAQVCIEAEIARQRVAANLRRAGESAAFVASLFSAPGGRLGPLGAAQTRRLAAACIDAYLEYLRRFVGPGAVEEQPGERAASTPGGTEQDPVGLALRDLYGERGEEGPGGGAGGGKGALAGSRPGSHASARPAAGSSASAAAAANAPAGAPAPLRFDAFVRDRQLPYIYGRGAGRRRAADLFAALERHGEGPEAPCAREALVVKLAMELHPQGPARVLEGAGGLWRQVRGGA